ncbi:unnamed protein product [Litomosoides sigmodontis]|uniref:Uncharacterized protein n=1 Tax=Litomosoides sigmodontis TaxID=42156 RepID=A0A3P6SC29_LITSI|nr:unnamed protein product [Litomosoides sigmodontis]
MCAIATVGKQRPNSSRGLEVDDVASLLFKAGKQSDLLQLIVVSSSLVVKKQKMVWIEISETANRRAFSESSLWPKNTMLSPTSVELTIFWTNCIRSSLEKEKEGTNVEYSLDQEN